MLVQCLGNQKRAENSQNIIPRPFFSSSTHGEIKLFDFQVKTVVLFSHSAYFTPVCTMEFVALVKIHDDLMKRNVQLIGLSIDSIFSHKARSEKFDIRRFTFWLCFSPWVWLLVSLPSSELRNISNRMVHIHTLYQQP